MEARRTRAADGITMTTEAARFDATVRVLQNARLSGDCWLVNKGSYRPKIRVGKRYVFAYRVIYESMIAPIPRGLVIDHLCRTPSCVNPFHLEPVTSRINILRGIGRTAQNAAKNECIHGHPFSGENLRLIKRKGFMERGCVQCLRRRNRKWGLHRGPQKRRR